MQYISNDECFVETTASSSNSLLPGRPLEYSHINIDVSIKECGDGSVSSMSAEFTGVTMVMKEI